MVYWNTGLVSLNAVLSIYCLKFIIIYIYLHFASAYLFQMIKSLRFYSSNKTRLRLLSYIK